MRFFFTYKYGFLVSLEKLEILARRDWGGVEAAPVQGPGPAPQPCALRGLQPGSATYQLRGLGHVS